MAGFMRRGGLAKIVVCALVLVAQSGCPKKDPPAPPVSNPKGAAVSTETRPSQPTPFAHLHKPFREACLTGSNAPEDAGRPPDKTVTGKNVAKLFEQIAGVNLKGGLWDEIRFVSPGGKRINYRAIIKTDLGSIELEFYPDEAPNHVRSFLALAKVGYYDGLAIDHILNTKIDDAPWTYMVGGCPLGTGETGQGSIGYWLLPEISEKLTHDVGTVGTWHGETLESAACRFYINLTKAPWLDGNYTIFAKISQGLDVARKISQQPVQEEDNRPKTPVVIREVTIQTTIDESQVVARTP